MDNKLLKLIILYLFLLFSLTIKAGNTYNPAYNKLKNIIENSDYPANNKVHQYLNNHDGLMAGPAASNDCNHSEHQFNSNHDIPNQKIEKQLSHQCEIFQKFLTAGVPIKPLRQAMFFYYQNEKMFNNNKKISIADYSLNSKNERFFRLDMISVTVKKNKVSHGSGERNKIKQGDFNHDGMIDLCKHENGSRQNMTRPGFFKTKFLYRSTGKKNSHLPRWASKSKMKYKGGWPYIKGNKNGMKIDGLTIGVNDKAYANGIVMHGAWYNQYTDDPMGRSYGCPAFTPLEAPEIINSLKSGSLYYAYVPKCTGDMAIVEKQISGWKNFCKDIQ